MRFDIVTIFPEMFSSYFSESILGRAQKEKLIKIKTHNLRNYAMDKHNTVDDTPYGGGAGMVMKVEPIFNCVERIKNEICDKKKCKKTAIDNFKEIFQRTGSRIVKNSKTRTSSRISNFRDDGEKVKIKSRIILFSAKGKRYTQQDTERLANYDNLILICGRYEGVDERVAKHIADEEISIGDYVLTGGEVPAMIIVDSVSRLLPKVLGNEKSLEEESHGSVQIVQDDEGAQNERNDPTSSTSQKRHNVFNEPKAIQRLQRAERYLEYPQYTKPSEFNNWKVPEVLLSGNHRKIKEWRNNFYKK